MNPDPRCQLTIFDAVDDSALTAATASVPGNCTTRSHRSNVYSTFGVSCVYLYEEFMSNTLETLYRDNRAAVFTWLRPRVNNAEDAEDLTQSAFLKLAGADLEGEDRKSVV